MLQRAEEGEPAEQAGNPHFDAAQRDAERVPSFDQSGFTLRTTFSSL
jgi:hypothetical protein